MHSGDVVPPSRDVRALTAEFERSYLLGRLGALREVERCVNGCDYGATSWTTRHEAERLAEWLELRSSTRLLDVGAGSGWPGLYFARITGCEVTLTDLPLAGLRVAAERAAAEELIGRCAVVLADGAKLPFRDGVFDRVSHSDVLCCMPSKLAMLDECRRVTRAGARMAFSVIVPAPELSPAERDCALDAGPPFVETPVAYPAMLDQSGWRTLDRMDVTTEYLQSARGLIAAMKLRVQALTKAYGSADFADRLQRREAALAATERGLLKREIFLAVAT
jgi:SAM-dependent methyltransferase